MNALQIVVGVIFGALSLLDAYKYTWESRKMRQVGTSAGHSRKFILAALASDVAKLAYGLAILDWFVIFSGAVAMVCMSEMLWTVYRLYPYSRKKNVRHPPSLFDFLVKTLKHPDRPL